MNSFKIKLPPNNIVKDFSDLIEPIFEQRRKNEEEMQTLLSLRENLLPRLMSGKIKV